MGQPLDFYLLHNVTDGQYYCDGDYWTIKKIILLIFIINTLFSLAGHPNLYRLAEFVRWVWAAASAETGSDLWVNWRPGTVFLLLLHKCEFFYLITVNCRINYIFMYSSMAFSSSLPCPSMPFSRTVSSTCCSSWWSYGSTDESDSSGILSSCWASPLPPGRSSYSALYLQLYWWLHW